MGDPARGAFLAVVIQDIGQHALVRPCSRGPPRTGRILAHPHVEGAVLHEGKPALGLVQLHRADTQGPGQRRPEPRPASVSRSENTPADQPHLVAVGRLPSAAAIASSANGSRSTPITRSAPAFKQIARIAALPPSVPSSQTPGDRSTLPQDRLDQDRDMGISGLERPASVDRAGSGPVIGLAPCA